MTNNDIARPSNPCNDSTELYYAEMEAARNTCMDAYFGARPQLLKTHAEQALYRAGFERAFQHLWNKARGNKTRLVSSNIEAWFNEICRGCKCEGLIGDCPTSLRAKIREMISVETNERTWVDPSDPDEILLDFVAQYDQGNAHRYEFDRATVLKMLRDALRPALNGGVGK